VVLVEVADTTLTYAREIKLPAYARHGIVEVWLINLNGGILEIYREPGRKGYRKLLRPDRPVTIAPCVDR